MLPKKHRLKKTKEIETVFKGSGAREGFLFLKLVHNNLKKSRFAFIVSKKTAKKAVVRNKIKRIMRAAIQKKLGQIKSGFDAVIVAQKGIELQDFNEIEVDIEKALKKAKLI